MEQGCYPPTGNLTDPPTSPPAPRVAQSTTVMRDLGNKTEMAVGNAPPDDATIFPARYGSLNCSASYGVVTVEATG
jgi:hypothetical protein